MKLQIYELYMGEPLLPDDVDQMLVPSLHTALFDQYPEELIKRGKFRDFFFNLDGRSITCYTSWFVET